MNHINKRQQELVDEIIKHYFHNKNISNYLKTRHDLINASTNPVSIASLSQLKFDLIKNQYDLTNYIKLINQILTNQTNSSLELNDLNHELLELVSHHDHLQEEIDNLNQVQKPLIDKITNLINKINNPSSKSTADNDVNIFTKSDIKQMFTNDNLQEDNDQELDDFISLQIDNLLASSNTTRLFNSHNSSDNQLIYNPTSSSSAIITTTNDLDDLDQLINKSVLEISNSFNEIQSIKSNWFNQSLKIDKIKQIIQGEDDDDQQQQQDIEI